jgi:hypothetical protein
VFNYKEGLFCINEITPPIRKSIQTINERKLKVTRVIPDNMPANTIIAPQNLGCFLYRNALISPIKAAYNPIHKNTFNASSEVCCVALSVRDEKPAAQAPEHIAAGRPRMPPIIPNTRGAFEIWF